MSPLAKALFEVAPYLFAFAVGALIPRRQGAAERFAIGVVAALSVLLLKSLWPSVFSLDEAKPHEWRILLSLIVFLSIFGAIGILFLPRQSPALLKRVTLAILGADFLASLALLSAPMTHS